MKTEKEENETPQTDADLMGTRIATIVFYRNEAGLYDTQVDLEKTNYVELVGAIEFLKHGLIEKHLTT